MVIGLTGGIACGKSAAAQMFEDAGAYIIDTDVISREVSESERAKTALKEEFGEAFSGDELDRAKLRKTVFADREKLKMLNRIMHPLIKTATANAIRSAAALNKYKLIVTVAPLLYEAGFCDLVNKSVTVSCNRVTRIRRLIKRDNITEELAESMINSQMSDDEREKRADIILYNNGSLAELRAQVVRAYCELAK